MSASQPIAIVVTQENSYIAVPRDRSWYLALTRRGESVERPDSDDDFAVVYRRYASAILRYAQRRLDGKDATWDVVNDTFTAAWRHCISYDWR